MRLAVLTLALAATLPAMADMGKAHPKPGQHGPWTIQDEKDTVVLTNADKPESFLQNSYVTSASRLTLEMSVRKPGGAKDKLAGAGLVVRSGTQKGAKTWAYACLYDSKSKGGALIVQQPTGSKSALLSKGKDTKGFHSIEFARKGADMECTVDGKPIARLSFGPQGLSVIALETGKARGRFADAVAPGPQYFAGFAANGTGTYVLRNLSDNSVSAAPAPAPASKQPTKKPARH